MVPAANHEARDLKGGDGGPTPSWGSARSTGLRVSGLDLFSPGQMRQKKLCSG